MSEFSPAPLPIDVVIVGRDESMEIDELLMDVGTGSDEGVKGEDVKSECWRKSTVKYVDVLVHGRPLTVTSATMGGSEYSHSPGPDRTDRWT